MLSSGHPCSAGASKTTRGDSGYSHRRVTWGIPTYVGMGTEVDDARKRVGIVVLEASGTGLVPRRGQRGAIHGERRRSRLSREFSCGRVMIENPANGESRYDARGAAERGAGGFWEPATHARTAGGLVVFAL